MLPDLSVLKGHVTEIHGTPDSGKTRLVLGYIRQMHEKHGALAYYIDAASKLKTDKLRGMDDAVWLSFDINNAAERALVDAAGKDLDIVVIDDFTFYRGDPWRFMSNLRQIARTKDLAILVINQRRHVLNHKTNEYEDKPYRYNVVQRYCTYALDTDAGTWSVLNTPHIECHLDDFTRLLLKGA